MDYLKKLLSKKDFVVVFLKVMFPVITLTWNAYTKFFSTIHTERVNLFKLVRLNGCKSTFEENYFNKIDNNNIVHGNAKAEFKIIELLSKLE